MEKISFKKVPKAILTRFYNGGILAHSALKCSRIHTVFAPLYALIEPKSAPYKIIDPKVQNGALWGRVGSFSGPLQLSEEQALEEQREDAHQRRGQAYAQRHGGQGFFLGDIQHGGDQRAGPGAGAGQRNTHKQQ